jgi:hypothetical protein
MTVRSQWGIVSCLYNVLPCRLYHCVVLFSHMPSISGGHPLPEETPCRCSKDSNVEYSAYN